MVRLRIVPAAISQPLSTIVLMPHVRPENVLPPSLGSRRTGAAARGPGAYGRRRSLRRRRAPEHEFPNARRAPERSAAYFHMRSWFSLPPNFLVALILPALAQKLLNGFVNAVLVFNFGQ